MTAMAQETADGMPARRGPGVVYPDIPEELRKASNEYVKLRGAGEPVPDDIREKHNEYKRWVAHGGRDPGTVPKKGHPKTYAPAHLRAASAEYRRLRLAGQNPPQDVVDAHNEHCRWLRYRGQPPEKRKRIPKPEEVEWPYSAYLEWNRLIREGTAPGDIPADIADGHAKHLGKPVKKYTPCEDSEVRHGHGCRGRHGKSNARRYFRKGTANCVRCSASYADVPEDVMWCGCCGSRLRKNPRSRSGSGADVPRIG